MGRIREMIDVNGRNSWTLFDTGARNTYILPAVASVLTVHKARHPVPHGAWRWRQGGNRNGYPGSGPERAPHIYPHAMVLDHIGLDEEGKEIEILFGALAMQQWGITMKQQPRFGAVGWIATRIHHLFLPVDALRLSTLRGHVFHLLKNR